MSSDPSNFLPSLLLPPISSSSKLPNVPNASPSTILASTARLFFFYRPNPATV